MPKETVIQRQMSNPDEPIRQKTRAMWRRVKAVAGDKSCDHVSGNLSCPRQLTRKRDGKERKKQAGIKSRHHQEDFHQYLVFKASKRTEFAVTHTTSEKKSRKLLHESTHESTKSYFLLRAENCYKLN